MTFAQSKLVVLVAWATTVVTIGLTLAVDKPALWVPIAILAIIPVAIGSWLWDAPEPTLSELIATARSGS
jgi:hypothetical protein